MDIQDSIRKDLFKAVKAGEQKKAAAYQVALAALKDAQIEKGRDNELTVEEEIEILRKEVSKVKDSIESFDKGGREDLKKEAEMQKEALERYLPAMMSEEDIEQFVEQKIKELGIKDKSGFGQLMGVLMKELKGKAEGDTVKKIVEVKLK